MAAIDIDTKSVQFISPTNRIEALDQDLEGQMQELKAELEGLMNERERIDDRTRQAQDALDRFSSALKIITDGRTRAELPSTGSGETAGER